jgi:translation initiation factor IF-2
MVRRSDDIDGVMDSVNEWEERQRGRTESSEKPDKILVGTVDKFFSKINVAAIRLMSELKVGDVIEIGNEEEAIRQKILSMQIDKENVDQASEGSDVGIKLKYPVSEGSEVYKIVK